MSIFIPCRVLPQLESHTLHTQYGVGAAHLVMPELPHLQRYRISWSLYPKSLQSNVPKESDDPHGCHIPTKIILFSPSKKTLFTAKQLKVNNQIPDLPFIV